jgi:hypothetical protein
LSHFITKQTQSLHKFQKEIKIADCKAHTLQKFVPPLGVRLILVSTLVERGLSLTTTSAVVLNDMTVIVSCCWARAVAKRSKESSTAPSR